MALDASLTILGTCILEIQISFSTLHRVGAQEGNPLQCYRSTEESASVLRTALAVIEHSLPGFERNRQQLHWPRLTAQTHSSALIQLTSLSNSAEKLSHNADSRVTRLPALIRRFYSRCSRDPLQKDAHRSWWETKVALCETAYKKKKNWPDSHDAAIQEVADSWDHPSWPHVLSNLRCIRDHPEGPPEKYSKPYKLQQVAWYNKAKAEDVLIRDIIGACRHLPEGFTSCKLAAYSPSVIIELAEFFHSQLVPVDLADSARVANNLRKILSLLGTSAGSRSFINTMRKGSPAYSLNAAFEEAFRMWEGVDGKP